MPHTPGEWQIVELGEKLDDWTGASLVVRERKHAPGGIAVIMGGLGIAEERANARLIASAGKLLAALELALPVVEAREHFLKSMIEKGGECPLAWCAAVDALQAIREAIALTGEPI